MEGDQRKRALPNIKGGSGEALQLKGYKQLPKYVSMHTAHCNTTTTDESKHASEFCVCSGQHFVWESFGSVQFPELLYLPLSLAGWPCILHDEGLAG